MIITKVAWALTKRIRFRNVKFKLLKGEKIISYFHNTFHMSIK